MPVGVRQSYRDAARDATRIRAESYGEYDERLDAELDEMNG
jgi:hypothetical protein